MKLLSIIIYTLFIINLSIEQVTHKQNKLLSRKRRYLNFPEGSNMVLTISSLKEILLKVPKGFRTLLECDVIFKLPNKSFRSYVKDLSMHTRHRREVYDEISKAIDIFGFNGDACMKKMICEAERLKPYQENSLFQQLLYTVLSNRFHNTTYANDDCLTSTINSGCGVSLLALIMNHIYK